MDKLYLFIFGYYDECSHIIAPTLEKAVKILHDNNKRRFHQPCHYRIIHSRDEVWELTVRRDEESDTVYRQFTRYTITKHELKEGYIGW